MTWAEAAGLAFLAWILFTCIVVLCVSQWGDLPYPSSFYGGILITVSPLAVVLILWFRALYLALEVNDPSGDEKQ